MAKLNIDWSKIKISYGSAEIIPEALEKLNSPDEREREWAYNRLDNDAVLQSDLYEAAYYVIDPIVELLERDDCLDYYRPIEILIEIALGWAPEDVVIEDEFMNIIPLEQACRSKLKELKPRIEKIKAKDQIDIEEKEFLLGTIAAYDDSETN